MLQYVDESIFSKARNSTCRREELTLGFDRLKDLSKNLDSVSYEDIYRILDTGIFGTFTGRTIKKGIKICRGRSNSNVQSFFTSEKDITYISSPQILNSIYDYGRANKPFQSVFYGSISSDEIPITYLTPVFECSVILRDKIIRESPIDEIITCGVWKVKKEFDVAELVYSSDAIKNSNYTQERFEFYKNEINKMPDTALREHCLDMLIFISNEFAKKEIKNSNEYKISCAYADLIWSKLQLAGILYPSVQSEYKSLNIALKPEAVDSYLSFQTAIMVRLKKIEKKVFIEDHYMLKPTTSNQKYFVWEKCKDVHF